MKIERGIFMADIVLTRVDFRLIHGQVIVKWRQVYQVTKIVVVDDFLAVDDFMTRIYTSAAPADITVKIYSEEKALRLWQKNEFGTGRVMLLFKDIETCHRMIKAGLPIKQIQLGGVPHAEDKKVILKAVSLNRKEVGLLKELHDDQVDIVVQVVPENPKLSYEDILKNFAK